MERTWLLGICSISGLRYQLKVTHNYSVLSASKDFNQHAKLSKSAKDRDWTPAVFLLTKIFCTPPWPNASFSVLPLLFLSLLFASPSSSKLGTSACKCCEAFTSSNHQDNTRNRRAEREKLLFNLKAEQWVFAALSWARLPCPCHLKNFGCGFGLLPSV